MEKVSLSCFSLSLSPLSREGDFNRSSQVQKDAGQTEKLDSIKGLVDEECTRYEETVGTFSTHLE